ncbi:bifunctional phosphopantothenoylcysteine decarboxylase/phosphopantothenate--cysteine ligase CoaBC [Lactobacillus sp. 3B(2020)]|uniref:bifunctional phosphopantothenoylcysteine decarboxylase/phosphopantothenate--cysteine ligase CoaBC n=1 Tax=Lactobacillus sp. 3B(2020) TaxID=2695882 RepID=UPI0015DEAE3E|nr:bifunctional phosphopantothenoylcysteine decarboxylase/phosphopantothenate--cysteine ligase CoaBC [Lactobacillus sp. 3B(2020)]QLL70201.1 bifunctional phosphopantothenoylcysteine decarboxylase/phosphopantothenate--cysteine ligase CoaBC [Lactobacillus sp. 3B(2020)]
MARIAVYVSGSVATFKAVSLVRILQKQGHEIRVGMTPASRHFVTPNTFYALTHQPVLTDLWQTNQSPVPHIELADWTELALVVPASADLIAKIANGLADDAVSSCLLATKAPVMLAPAMNSQMWLNPATQRNLKQLVLDQRIILTPETGMLAEGYVGKGRMMEPEEIAGRVDKWFTNQNRLAGKTILVTAGGTREAIDPVRFIGNRSSGKMGLAVVQAALAAGAKVIAVIGQVQVEFPNHPNLMVKKVTTTAEMLATTAASFEKADALVMAAAVADFRPAVVADQKIKKQTSQDELTISLVKNPDILATLGAKKNHQIVMGFAAETNDLLQNAQVKLAKKHADYIVANDVSQVGSGFGVATDQVTILQPNRVPEKWPLLSKQEVGERLINILAKRWQQSK